MLCDKHHTTNYTIHFCFVSLEMPVSLLISVLRSYDARTHPGRQTFKWDTYRKCVRMSAVHSSYQNGYLFDDVFVQRKSIEETHLHASIKIKSKTNLLLWILKSFECLWRTDDHSKSIWPFSLFQCPFPPSFGSALCFHIVITFV